MRELIAWSRDFNTFSMILRLTAAALCGGIIGIERGVKGRAAGFRTHSLVCVGSALTMLTGQYVYEYICGTTDPARIGAQVISGIGFLGVGTIITTRSKKVRGLTTAAGLWASACIGLACGIGYYEAALFATVLVTIVMNTLQKVDRYFYKKSTVRECYIEVHNVAMIRQVMQIINESGSHVISMEMEKDIFGDERSIGLLLMVRVPKREMDLIELFGGKEGVLYVEEI